MIKSRLAIVTRLLVLAVSLFLMAGMSPLIVDESKTASLKGKVFRSDTNTPIPSATIILLDQKRSDKHDNSVQARTDDQGNYSIPNVAVGKYTISIRAWYKTQEEAPCQLLMGKTADKDSTVLVMRDKDRFVEQVLIKGFSIKAGKELVRDFDFSCKSMFAK